MADFPEGLPSKVPGRAAVVMVESYCVFNCVMVAGAFVIVAVTAVPLELTVMRVCPVSLVVMATYVAVVPSPIVEDKPGVSVRTDDPRVI